MSDNLLNIKFNDSGCLRDLLVLNYNRYINYKKFVKEIEDTTSINESENNFIIETYHYLDIDNINKINNSIVFIDAISESVHLIEQGYFSQYNKSNFYVIFSNSIWNKNQYRLDIDYINLDYWYFIQQTISDSANSYKENYYYSKEYDFDYPKNNIFVSTTGAIRKERSYLIDNLIEKINYDNFVLKYQGENLGKNYNHCDFYRVTAENFDAYSPIFGDFVNISSLVPTKLYNQAYFNLVVETDIDYPCSFDPTEKIGKALLTGIPFVVYSTPNFLQNLHNLGFKTYNELWNEDYDTEFDYTKRADKIIDLCNQLENFNWQANKEKLQQIANHNAALMLKNNDMFIAQFEKIRQTLEIIKDKDAQYLKNNPQLFEWLDNSHI